MVEELSQDFTNISKQLENAIRIAGNAGDDVSRRYVYRYANISR